MVELTIASVLLLTLMMGMLEIGIMLSRYMGISEASRASVRSAALGSMTGVVSQRAVDTLNVLGLLSSGGASITMQYRTYDKASGVWTGWQALTDGANGYNSAPCDQNFDSQVRVSVTYTYSLITGTLLSSVIGNNGQVTLRTTSIMRRESTP
jgi:hypothetical protein